MGTFAVSAVPDPVQFDSVEGALRFAFRQDRENYQGAIINRMAGSPSSPGRGLGGLDGAAMAGMIRRQVAGLGEDSEAILRARYVKREQPCPHCKNGTTHTKEWEEAVLAVMAWTNEAITGISHYRFRHGVVSRHFGARVHLGELRQKCNLAERTAGDHIQKIKSFLQKKEGAAMHAISINLREAGIVHTAD